MVHAAFQDPFPINIPALIAALDSSARLMIMREKRDSWVWKEGRDLEELVVGWKGLENNED
jgi:hypothetical protein